MRTGKFFSWAFVVVLMIGANVVASATTRFVTKWGADMGACAAKPCRTIGYAITQAAPGDIVKVGEGKYAESVTVDKQLILIGSNDGDSGRDRTVIDASGNDNGMVITGAGAAGSMVRNLTVKNAGREGIFVVQTSDVTIADNILTGNDAYGPNSPQCPAASADDCGEALHLESVTNSVVSGNLVLHNVGGILLTDEEGPTSGNLITHNLVVDNPIDCGITLASHYFSMDAPAAADAGGVYDNYVIDNISNSNGSAGIGIFAGPPGGAAYRNSVIGNTARNNGLPGVAIHSHSPFQYVNDNVIAENVLSNNGPDDDAMTGDPAGITVWSAVIPIPHTTVAGNSISHEHFGIFTTSAVSITGLLTNSFKAVAIPLSQH